MTDNIGDLTAKAENMKIDSKFEKWNDLPEEVKLEYNKAMQAEKSSPASDNTVKLDIGGTIFKTSKSTLTMQDGFFKTMLETSVPVTKDSSDCIFIDRSAKNFDLILNFMRDGDVALPDSSRELSEIQKEAQYYLLTGLMEKCKEKIKELCSTWMGLWMQLKNEKISLTFSSTGIAVQVYPEEGGYESYEMKPPQDRSDFQSFAEILKSNNINSICIYNIVNLKELEMMVPSQVMHPRSMHLNARDSFDHVVMLLKLCWNEMQQIEIQCIFELIPFDQLMACPAVTKANELIFRQCNSDQLFPIFDKWAKSDLNINQRLNLQSGSPEAAIKFSELVRDRTVCYYGSSLWIIVKCVDPSKEITVKVHHIEGPWPMIYCYCQESR